MKSLHRNGTLHRAVLFLTLVSSLVSAQDQADRQPYQCKPYRWGSPEDPADPWPTQGIPTVVTVGEINCRYWTTTPAEVNHYTCLKISQRYSIFKDKLLKLNPNLAHDCSNVQPNTDYCVRGFIEPLRAFDGKCGPPNNNATCLGTDKQCCNSQTWTCGDSPADCARGTCYEGVCDGDIAYSTDGTCGQDHGIRSCAGRWGNCCSVGGRCGTGPAYCGLFTCQQGDCDIWKNDNLPKETPVTPDGTCGGAEGYRCSVDWGRCCNVNGVCAEKPADCYLERGCQSAFGICESNRSTVCVQGVGEGDKASLCSYACRFGYCPAASGCTCTLYGETIAEPPVLGTPGKPAPGITDEGFVDLCAFTCHRGYCPPEVCVYA